ncbi:MAG TPA: hypothetical protein VF647_01765 [Longimicrobium sp.]
MRYERSHRPDDVPDEVIREWVTQLADRIGFREVAALLPDATRIPDGSEITLSPETIRKFAAGIGRAERTTIVALRRLFLKRHPWGYVAEKGTPYGTPKPLPLLSEMLSQGHAEARAEIEKLVELAKRHPDEVPASADRLRSWLQKMLDAEYTGEDLSKRPLDADGNPIPNDPPEG